MQQLRQTQTPSLLWTLSSPRRQQTQQQLGKTCPWSSSSQRLHGSRKTLPRSHLGGQLSSCCPSWCCMPKSAPSMRSRCVSCRAAHSKGLWHAAVGASSLCEKRLTPRCPVPMQHIALSAKALQAGACAAVSIGPCHALAAAVLRLGACAAGRGAHGGDHPGVGHQDAAVQHCLLRQHSWPTCSRCVSPALLLEERGRLTLRLVCVHTRRSICQAERCALAQLPEAQSCA